MSELTKPDSIFLQVCTEDEEFPVDEATWCQDRINDSDVEYVRADLVEQQLSRAQSNCDNTDVQIEDMKQQLAAKDATINRLKVDYYLGQKQKALVVTRTSGELALEITAWICALGILGLVWWGLMT